MISSTRLRVMVSLVISLCLLSTGCSFGFTDPLYVVNQHVNKGDEYFADQRYELAHREYIRALGLVLAHAAEEGAMYSLVLASGEIELLRISIQTKIGKVATVIGCPQYNEEIPEIRKRRMGRFT